ncbi:MAG: NADH-quinone oxidoreductase subunit N, partial [Chloroflexota bacterium]|nr:NADH-quinone oxidoreductase subunit N [Chloroflexota bacterium]
LVGLMFKVSAVPFHMWAPDVYEGAPYPVTAYLAIGSKAAAFALILRLVGEGFVPATERWEQWQVVFAVLATITMLVGNLVALAQKNLKRLLAYSSIGHAGFLLAGITAMSFDSPLPSNGVMFYLVGYSITNLVVFAAIISFFNMTGKEMIADLGGLADHQPFLAACLAMGLFSLAGLPIFAGFTMKFYLFTAVASEGYLWLAAVAIFASLISLYYYLQILRQVYIEPTPTENGVAMIEAHPDLTKPPSLSLLAVLACGAGAIIWLGIYPKPLIDAIEAASRALLN